MNQHELYKALEVTSDEELLRHFPNRYEDLKPTPISDDPADGERIVAKGTVFSMKSFLGRGTPIIRFSLKTMINKSISCMLYNQGFYITKLSSGKELLVVAYYSKARKVYMVQSIFDIDSYYVMTGLRPIYSLPKTVSSSYFASFVKKLLSYPREAEYVVSKLPKRLVDKYRLINEFDAYKCVHLPRNEKMLNEGLRVFKYEEALAYSINALSMKKLADKRKKISNRPIDHNQINLFVSTLQYKLTRDQLKSVHDIILDMESDKIMYRLLQGDVGTGKTIVAFIALYANYLRRRQGVLMAPTFELAKQHYQNALKVFAPYDIKIAFLGGNTLKAKEKRELLQGLDDGSIDILIGTHSAFSGDIVFKDLGLTIIDEQQRFGVEQREELLNKGEYNDLLMMSATPIPRTLSQIMNADLDVSTLDEFPHGRRNVKTGLVNSADPLIHRAIEKALAAKRQVFIVAPKIEKGTNLSSSAESVFEDISERYGRDKVQLLHGKIKKEEQDSIIASFVDGEKPILVSTTVIEVGIDVSSAGLLIVYDANYFGLSSLHQLRGRIGRSGDFSLALLIYDGNDKDAKEKLQFLVDHEDGLAISEFDLRLRGTGSYSGSSQSGKSELTVCNFVDDLRMFECAKQDAKEILDNPSDEDNARYLKSLDPEHKLFLA